MTTRCTTVLALLLPILGADARAQTTIHVPRDQPSIQAAIDAASSGDTILVAPGRYFENPLVDGKVLTIRAMVGPAATTIDGGDLETVVRMWSGADGVLAGFTLTNGDAPSSGGGLRILDSSPRIEGCRIEHNTALSDGGGVAISGGGPTLVNCIVRGNGTTYWDGGGIHLGFAQGTVITNCTVVDNHVPIDGWAGGIWDNNEDATISNCIVRDNQSGWSDWDIGAGPGTVIQYTNYGESFGTNGNFDEPANFVDQAGGDLHLKGISTSRDRGLASAPGLPTTDYDGNPRQVGAAVDVGADEYAPYAYFVGVPTPGQMVTVRAAGATAGAQAVVWGSTALRPVRVTTPWGDFHLENRRFGLLSASVGAEGWTEASWSVPSTLPAPSWLFAQGLVDWQMTPPAGDLVE